MKKLAVVVFALIGSFAHAQQQGGAVTLFQGYTGTSQSYGWYMRDQAAGTGQDLKSGYGNYGGVGVTAPTGGATGVGAGLLGLAAFNDRNIGVLARSTEYKAGATNAGFVAFALNNDTGGNPSGTTTGLYIALDLPPTSKAALDAQLQPAAAVIDNRLSLAPVLVLRNNGATVFEVPLGGGAQLHDVGIAQPTCDAAHRFLLWAIASGNGVADRYEVCGKDQTDAYAWKPAAIF